jgi:hypothetical protein
MTEEHPNLAAALVAALAGVTVVEKTHTATVEMKTGGKYTYDYADLGDVVKLTRPVLAEHGLVVLTPVEEHGDGLKTTVVVLHTSGERMDFGPFPFPHGATAQATGSLVTYYRRYALQSALGIATGDDDDGASATPAPVQAQRPQEPKAPHEEHEAIRAIVANLAASQKATAMAWWAEQRLPSIKSGNPLTVTQAAAVLDYLEELDTTPDEPDNQEPDNQEPADGVQSLMDGLGGELTDDSPTGAGPSTARAAYEATKTGRPRGRR